MSEAGAGCHGQASPQLCQPPHMNSLPAPVDHRETNYWGEPEETVWIQIQQSKACSEANIAEKHRKRSRPWNKNKIKSQTLITGRWF